MQRLRELPRRVFERLGLAAHAAVEDMGVPVERDYRAMSLAERIAAARSAADDIRQRQRDTLSRDSDKEKGGDAR